MLPALVLLAPVPPSGTTTATVLCEWLTQATGVSHAIGGELQDYPVFLSVRSTDPGRIEALVAAALAGEWTKDGSTVRLLPTPPKRGEGLDEFTRGWKAATATRPNLAALPVEDVYAMRAGEILRYGLPAGPYVKPLPETLRKKAEAGAAPTAEVYVRRFANGSFETKVNVPDEQKGAFAGDSDVGFKALPPEVTAALGDESEKTVLSADATAAIQKLMANPSRKTDPATIVRTDPLERFVTPVLKPLAAALKEDLVVALPDFALMTLVQSPKPTVGGILSAFSLCDDWTLADGALVGRLPVSERRNRAQTRRSALSNFMRRSQDVGVPSSSAVAEYLSGQRPPASESWSDVMLLVTSGLVLDQTNMGDYPFNLRLETALTPDDWARLRTGGTFPVGTLSSGARRALMALLVQSRDRMNSEHRDPVRWKGFPNAPLSIAAKVEEEDVVLGLQGGITNVMKIDLAGYGYRRAKEDLGAEPLYRPGRRRALTLTIAAPGADESIETGFADVDVAKDAKSVPWTGLPPEMRKAFDEAVKRRDGDRPSQPSTSVLNITSVHVAPTPVAERAQEPPDGREAVSSPKGTARARRRLS